MVRPTVLSVFISDLGAKRVVEVKLDGVDWPGMEAAFAAVAPEAAGAMVLLRELAVIVPVGPPPPLARAPILRTLHANAATAAWPGSAHHAGALAAPLTPALLAALEADLGPLPPDYRDFLATVAASGAGPGYGLLSPLGASQAALARGAFAWAETAAPVGDPAGVLALAHAGCGVMWFLVLQGPRRGEVWVDARSSDRTIARVAGSFGAWYRDWLAAVIADAPWLHWDAAACATANVVSRVLEGTADDLAAQRARLAAALAPHALSLASSGSAIFPPKTALNPCHGCVALAARFTLGPEVFAPGVEPALDAPVFASPAPRSWWARLTSRRGQS